MWDVCNELDRYVGETRKTPGQKKSLWQGVSGGRGGVSLGYRKASRGAGAWIVKIALDGVRCEERLGAANDDDATPGGAATATTASATYGGSGRLKLPSEWSLFGDVATVPCNSPVLSASEVAQWCTRNGIPSTGNASLATPLSASTAACPDTTPPTVSITAPAAGASLSGSVALSADASDNVGVASVQFTVDGTPVGPVLRNLMG